MADTTFEDFLASQGIDPSTLLQMVAQANEGSRPDMDKHLADAPGLPQDEGAGLDIQSLLTHALQTTPGKGMDDDIPAVIDGKAPADISSNEYIIPADVVSMLGDGSSEAGGSVLDNLLSLIRGAKTGSTEQAPKLADVLGQ